jgi:hypothetical protein
MKCFLSGKECEFALIPKKNKVFIISPFGYPYDDLFTYGIKEMLNMIALKEIKGDRDSLTLEPERADQTIQLGFVMCQRICRKIRESNYVLADISEPNPNVFYELGLSFGLNKKIILIGREPLENALTFGLTDYNIPYIHYETLRDFKKKNKGEFVQAFQHAKQNDEVRRKVPESRILNIINSKNSILGLHETILEESIYKLNGESNTRLLNDWKVNTIAIGEESKLGEIIDLFQSCKVCVIDTSIYKGHLDAFNAYVFFCLGLGHGFKREVIPLTNTADKQTLPFDVRGLYHIFFDRLDKLKSQFMDILPDIDRSWDKEQEDQLYEQIWGPFIKNDCLQILTCGRNIKHNRGDRTNIDKWDFMSVSQLTNFIGKRFPNKDFEISAPLSKLSAKELRKLNVKDIREKVKSAIYDKDCIIVGSPDVSDLAEIILAEIHDLDPYVKRRIKSKGYALIKDLDQPKPSSIYWIKKGKEHEGVCQIDEEATENTYHFNTKKGRVETIYGILIIANNPFVSPNTERKIMVISGFSGPATYGISKFVADEKYNSQLKNMDKKINFDDEFEALIKIRFSVNSKIQGDNRIFRDKSGDIHFCDVKVI